MIKSIFSKLLGTGITHKIPFLRTLYERAFKLINQDKLIQVPITDQGLNIWVNAQDSSVGAMIRLKKSYEPYQSNLFALDVKRSKVLIDVGANIGYYSLLAAEKNPNIKIYSFEPDTDNQMILNKNLEKHSNARIQKEALGNKTGKAKFRSDKYQKGNSSIADTDEYSYEVEITTFDKFVQKNSITPDLIKVDIEGSEMDFLEGALGSFKKLNNIKMYIEYNRSLEHNENYTPDELPKLIQHLGFEIWIIDETNQQLHPYSNKAIQAINSAYFTLYCIKG